MERAGEISAGEPAAARGRLPLAVAVVDEQGAVSHWSAGAARLFGVPRERALGMHAVELMPVSGAFGDEDGQGHGYEYGPGHGGGPGHGDGPGDGDGPGHGPGGWNSGGPPGPPRSPGISGTRDQRGGSGEGLPHGARGARHDTPSAGFGYGTGQGAPGSGPGSAPSARGKPGSGFKSGSVYGDWSGQDLSDEPPLAGRVCHPTSGLARMSPPGGGSADVVWWAYPLIGHGPGRLLVLAADGARIRTAEEPPQPSGERPAEPAGGVVEEPPGGPSAYTAAGQGEGCPPPQESAAWRVAPGFALHTDFPGSDRLAGSLPGILPGMGPRECARVVDQILELGYPVLEMSRHERVPVTPDWGVPRRVERRGRLLRAAGSETDPEAARAAVRELESDLEYAAVRERLEFLNEVSASIGSSLDLARTVREVNEAVVPRFTDVAGTYLREQVVAGEGFPDGTPDETTLWHRVAVEHDDEPGRWDDILPVGEVVPVPAETPFFRCMTSGSPVMVPRVTDAMVEAIAGQFEKRDITPLLSGRSLLVLPLKARNVVLGFMVLLRHEERPDFDDMDRVTGAELAARAGLVLDNARMYAYQENVAETLQDSMLPRIERRMAGCDTATRYLPGTELGRVGGDWFDTVKLPGSRTALVVGDVMGHGLESAAMMGQLRTAVTTMASVDLPPARLLRKLDDLARRLGDGYLATCLYAVYDPIRSELRVANAGHIPPVLVRAADGRSRLLDLPTGAPIGVGGVPFETVTVPVAPGDRLVLCTDGLVEVRGTDIGEGLAALCESAAHPAASMDDACDTVIRELARTTASEHDGGRKDDIALLMARLNGISLDDVAAWKLASRPRQVRRARHLVRDQLTRWGLHTLDGGSVLETAELLVSEVVTNAVRHARGDTLELRLVRTGGLLCEVADDDQALPVLGDAAEDEEYGRGLGVVSRLAGEWGTSRGSHGKTVWFEQPLPHR